MSRQPNLGPWIILGSFLLAVGAAIFSVHKRWEAMDPTAYPTGPDLRRAADAAMLRQNDDPLLPEVLEAASRAAADGKYACSLELITAEGDDLPPVRRDKITKALLALKIRALFRWGPGDRYSRVELSWQ